jgi:hypothetical protein
MRLSSALNDSVVTKRICRRSCLQPNPDSFRKELYYLILDFMIGEFSRRFSGDSINMLRAIGTLVPSGDEFLNFQKLELLANQYKCNLADLQLEINQIKRMISRKTYENSSPSAFQTLFDFVSFLWPYRDAFYELNRLSRIALTLPVTSAECERSFSTLKLVKTRIRNSMCDERLSNLVFLSIHKDRLKSLNLDTVLDRFAHRYPQTRICLI